MYIGRISRLANTSVTLKMWLASMITDSAVEVDVVTSVEDSKVK